MQLSQQTITGIRPQQGLLVPEERLFSLPEKVLQFGTGVLLRALPDYFIDKANRAGIFNGRIVVVKSTATGDTDSFARQDGLYTICVRGIEKGNKIDEAIINSSISRVLSAREDWKAILACAHDPGMKVIISNTTEVGIVLENDDINLSPPKSFPGKLLAFLFERYKAFHGQAEGGMVIVPTELIPDNATRLKSILTELARINRMEDAFLDWLVSANYFCNSLVDRIVPGMLTPNDLETTRKKLGYRDDLMIMAESFRLWAIESDQPLVKETLSFAEVDPGIVIAPGIEKFRELKLRVLNGTHTFSCGLAHLAGFATVREAMGNEFMSSFISNLACEEIVTAISDNLITEAEAREFAGQVLDRFRNPFIDHQWKNICVQYSSKMKLRNVPLIKKYIAKTNQVPELMALGFAAYLLYMKGNLNSKKHFTGQVNGTTYFIQDDLAAAMAEAWKANDTDAVVDTVLANREEWDADLGAMPGFADTVKTSLHSLMKNGVMPTLRSVKMSRTIA